jgi:hypothetical protein
MSRLPQPREPIKGGEVRGRTLTQGLQGSREEQHHPHHLNVLGNGVKEGPDVSSSGRADLSPIKQAAAARQDGLGGPVDGELHVVDGGRQAYLVALEADLHLEEGALGRGRAGEVGRCALGLRKGLTLETRFFRAFREDLTLLRRAL